MLRCGKNSTAEGAAVQQVADQPRPLHQTARKSDRAMRADMAMAVNHPVRMAAAATTAQAAAAAALYTNEVERSGFDVKVWTTGRLRLPAWEAPVRSESLAAWRMRAEQAQDQCHLQQAGAF